MDPSVTAVHRRPLAVAAVRRLATASLSVLGGDFNIASTSALYPLIVDQGAWHDPFAVTDPPTYRAEFLPAGRTAHRIDYLLVSGRPVASADLTPADLSDHLALRAVVNTEV